MSVSHALDWSALVVNLLFVFKFGSKKFHSESKAPPRHQQSGQDRHLFPDPPRHPTVGQDMTRITFKTKFRTEPFNGAVNPIIGQPVRCDRVGPRIAPVRVRPSLAVQRMDPNFKTNNKFATKALQSRACETKSTHCRDACWEKPGLLL